MLKSILTTCWIQIKAKILTQKKKKSILKHMSMYYMIRTIYNMVEFIQYKPLNHTIHEHSQYTLMIYNFLYTILTIIRQAITLAFGQLA